MLLNTALDRLADNSDCPGRTPLVSVRRASFCRECGSRDLAPMLAQMHLAEEIPLRLLMSEHCDERIYTRSNKRVMPSQRDGNVLRGPSRNRVLPSARVYDRGPSVLRAEPPTDRASILCCSKALSAAMANDAGFHPARRTNVEPFLFESYALSMSHQMCAGCAIQLPKPNGFTNTVR